ncbi:MAG: signal peptidase II, partial [Desemzia incerta]
MYIYYILAVLMVGLDQWTKILTVDNIALYETIEFIPGVLSWTYIQNDGAAWSILEDKRILLLIITVF